MYGESSPSHYMVKEWAKQFWLGRDSIKDGPRQNRPAEQLIAEAITLVQEVQKDR